MILVADAPAGPAAALALIEESGADGLSRIRPLSAPASEEVRAIGPGSDSQAIAEMLVEALELLVQEGQSIVLCNVPDSTALGQVLKTRSGWRLSTVSSGLVRLPVDYTAMSRSTRRDHNRRRREWNELETSGRRVSFLRSDTSEGLMEAYEELTRLHQRRWTGRPRGRAAAPSDQLARVLKHCGSASGAFVARLCVDDETVAAQLCLRRGRRVCSVLTAMDPGRAPAPGHALLRHLTALLAAEGVDELDLGPTLPDAGQYRYKAAYRSTWSTRLTAVCFPER